MQWHQKNSVLVQFTFTRTRHTSLDLGLLFLIKPTLEELNKADYVFYMDALNKRYMERLFGNLPEKCHIITEYSENISFIDDPWYTGQFDEVVEQITECCENIITKLLLKNRK